MLKKRKILSLDLGAKKTGLAVAEEGFVLGRGVINGWEGWGGLIDDLKKVIANEKVESLVVGIPQSKSGDAAQLYRQMIIKIKHEIKLPIHEIDETLTSHEAIKQVGHSHDDEEAAKIILEDYLGKD